MGAVEYADVSALWEFLFDSPEEVVLAFFFGGGFERRKLQALRVDRSEHVPDYAALARGVHPLQHEEYGWSVGVVCACLRVHAFLQVGKGFIRGFNLLGCPGLRIFLVTADTDR